jgi:hypothetical protein
MNTELDALLKLSPPRYEAPRHTPAEWLDIEQRLGTRLPDDYKEYIEHYGGSNICDYLVVVKPFGSTQYTDLVDFAQRQLDAYRSLREEFGEEEVPLPLFPELDGLLPWGLTANGDVLFWRTIGEPNQWTVVVNGSRTPWYEEFPYGMAAFILRLFTGKLTGDVYEILALDWDEEIVIEQY